MATQGTSILDVCQPHPKILQINCTNCLKVMFTSAGGFQSFNHKTTDTESVGKGDIVWPQNSQQLYNEDKSDDYVIENILRSKKVGGAQG